MRHRYIFCGTVWEDPRIKNYRLLSNLKYSEGQAIRVNIPDSVELDKCKCDSYSTTECEKVINELGCDCYFLYKGQWRKFNWLKNIEPCWWFRALEYIFGLNNCYDTIGWTDDLNYYKEWFWNPKISREDIIYPRFKEDKKGLKLKVNLNNDEETVSLLRKGSGETDWLKFYDKFAEQIKENPHKEIWCE